jgi:radical SAM protein with 4Fe4S-binding SPASM domain
MPRRNKYSNMKLAWYDEKRTALAEKRTTAPIYVRIKPTNRCCHGCLYCAYNADVSDMHRGMQRTDEINADRLIEILAELGSIGVEAVTFSGGGEPLVHPRICEIFGAAEECGMQISLLTNGQLLEGERAEALEHASWVRVSLDSVSEEQFELHRRRPGRFYRQTLHNISTFAATKSPDCELTANWIVTEYNVGDIVRAAELCESLGIENVRFSPMWTPDFTRYHRAIVADVMLGLSRARARLSRPGFEISDTYTLEPHMHCRSYTRCYVMEIIPVIGADGAVYACHNKAYTEEGRIGSILDRSFTELWFSAETRRFFDSFDPSTCTHQCSNDSKNRSVDEMIGARGDPFI